MGKMSIHDRLVWFVNYMQEFFEAIPLGIGLFVIFFCPCAGVFASLALFCWLMLLVFGG